MSDDEQARFRQHVGSNIFDVRGQGLDPGQGAASSKMFAGNLNHENNKRDHPIDPLSKILAILERIERKLDRKFEISAEAISSKPIVDTEEPAKPEKEIKTLVRLEDETLNNNVEKLIDLETETVDLIDLNVEITDSQSQRKTVNTIECVTGLTQIASSAVIRGETSTVDEQGGYEQKLLNINHESCYEESGGRRIGGPTEKLKSRIRKIKHKKDRVTKYKLQLNKLKRVKKHNANRNRGYLKKIIKSKQMIRKISRRADRTNATRKVSRFEIW